MKKAIIVFIISLAWCSTLSAQHDDAEPIPNLRTAFNFYGSLLTESSAINQEFAFSLGATMGVTYRDNFYLGGYYISLVTEHFRYDIPNWRNTKLRTSFNHGGLIAGYILKPQGLHNAGFSIRAGWGSVWFYDHKEGNTDRLNDLYRGTRDHVFVLTPAAEYTLTPIRWLRIGIGGGYRFTFMLDRYNKADFDGFTGVISLYFGGFRGSDINPANKPE